MPPKGESSEESAQWPRRWRERVDALFPALALYGLLVPLEGGTCFGLLNR